MIMSLLTFLLISLVNSGILFDQLTPSDQDALPDNYLVFSLDILDNRFEGTSEHLGGFIISMQVPKEFIKNSFDYTELLTLVRNHEINGKLTYPNGKTTRIQYEVVKHRETEDIYMKTTLGYFLWEHVNIQDNKLFFAIYWWYCPPVREVDLEVIKMTKKLLTDSINWHKDDDRKCENDIESNKWSLFCALKYASIKKTGEYNHHNTAMQTVRFVIDDLIPNHGFEHTLKDYNNSSSTTHEDIMNVIDLAKKRIQQKLEKAEHLRFISI